jgi:hypothetical protein
MEMTIAKHGSTKNVHSSGTTFNSCLCSSKILKSSSEVLRSDRTYQGLKSRDSSVSIALGYGLDDRGSRVRFPAGAGTFSLHRRVQNGSGAHPASYPMGTRGSFPGVKCRRREADHSPTSSAGVKEWVELYVHSPNTPSWRGAQLKHRDNVAFTFYQGLWGTY